MDELKSKQSIGYELKEHMHQELVLGQKQVSFRAFRKGFTNVSVGCNTDHCLADMENVSLSFRVR